MTDMKQATDLSKVRWPLNGFAPGDYMVVREQRDLKILPVAA